MLTKAQITGKYGKETKKVSVKAWGGEVEIRKLTVAEHNKVQAILMKDMEVTDVKDSKLEVSIGRASEAAVLAVSFSLVSPAMTINDLSGLSSGAMDGVTEIKAALDEWDKPKKSQRAVKDSSD